MLADGGVIGTLPPYHEATLQIVEDTWCLTAIGDPGSMMPATLVGLERLVDPIPGTTVPLRTTTALMLDGSIVPVGTLIVRRNGHLQDANA